MPSHDLGDLPRKMLLYLDDARWRRDDQIERIASLDRKLATMFALNAAVIAFFAALLSFAIGTERYPLPVLALLSAALAVFLVNIVLSSRAYRVSKWIRYPTPQTLKRYTLLYSEAGMILWVADEINRQVDLNEDQVQRKARLVTWSVVLSVLTIVLVVAAATAALWLR